MEESVEKGDLKERLRSLFDFREVMERAFRIPEDLGPSLDRYEPLEAPLRIAVTDSVERVPLEDVAPTSTPPELDPEGMMEEGRYQEAIQAYRDLLERDPYSGYVRERLIEALVESGQNDAAADESVRLARLYLAMGKLAEARDVAEQALRLAPGLRAARAQLARVARAEGERDAAPVSEEVANGVDSFDLVVPVPVEVAAEEPPPPAEEPAPRAEEPAPPAEEPADRVDPLAAAEEHLHAGRHEEAARVLRSLGTAHPQAEAVVEKLLSDLRIRIDANPADLESRFAFGMMCYLLDRPALAVLELQRTRSHPAYAVRSLQALARVSAGKGRISEALQQFRQALAIPGRPPEEYADVRYHEAEVLAAAGRRPEALKHYLACLALVPGHRDAEDRAAALRSADASSPG